MASVPQFLKRQKDTNVNISKFSKVSEDTYINQQTQNESTGRILCQCIKALETE